MITLQVIDTLHPSIPRLYLTAPAACTSRSCDVYVFLSAFEFLSFALAGSSGRTCSCSQILDIHKRNGMSARRAVGYSSLNFDKYH
eukprot:m.43729 g.43729  ORF g.43729 m.43729 type:complete len:86 (+) comp12956_c0_seq1:131-388(+)